jgi:transcriptional repressor NrdR
MKCPYCKSDNVKVVDSRDIKGGLEIRRRRECIDCGARFTTYERIEEKHILVIKKSGDREILNREKMVKSIIIACRKRPISAEQIDEIVNRIYNKICESERKEIKSIFIGELIMEELKKLDKVAYVRFASVYRDFRDIKEFEEELKELREQE